MRKVLFHPYSRQQMASILRQQVQQLPGPVFEPMALSLCAAKVCRQATVCEVGRTGECIRRSRSRFVLNLHQRFNAWCRWRTITVTCARR